MKRFLALLVACILLGSFSIAYAADYDFSGCTIEELLSIRNKFGEAINKARMEKINSNVSLPSFDGEITFRDLKWGESFSEVQKKYPKLWEGSSSFLSKPVFRWAGGEEAYSYINDYLTRECKNYSKLTVGGYEASSEFLFAYTITSPIVYECSNTMLIGAKYIISDLADPDGVANDLVNKLTSVYGECSATTSGHTSGVYCLLFRYFWTGNNDTFIILKEQKGDSTSYNEVEIYYGWRGSNELLYAFDDAITADKEMQEAKKFGNGDTSGL